MFWKKDSNKSQKNISQKKFEKEMYIPKKTLQKKERSLAHNSVVEKERPKNYGRKILVGILWVLFLLELIYILFFTGVFSIKNIQVTGEAESIHLESFLRKSFDGNYFSFFSRDNILFVNIQSLEQHIRERYPRLQEVSVERVLPGDIHVTVSVKPYQLLWCKEESGCFLLDEDGRLRSAHIFFQYKDEQGIAHMIEDQTQRNVKENDIVITTEEVTFIKRVIEDFDFRSGLTREGSIIRPHEYTKEIRIKTTKGFFIYLPAEGDFDVLMSTLRLFLEKEVPESEWEQIQYIDLRTENRIYYTRKDKQPENPTKEEESSESGNVINEN